MLVVNDRRLLGDSHLDAVENLAKVKEGNAAILEKRKIWGQKELEDHERSAGPRMPYQELIRRLQKLNQGIRVKDGSPGNVALYVLKNRREMEEPEREKSPNGPFFDDHKYVGGMPMESLPEFAHVTLNQQGIAHREIRGWRSVLIGLIRAGVITYEQVKEEFGEPSGPRAARWFEQLKSYKAGLAARRSDE